MPYKLIVSDWNGTILRHPTDEMQNRHIAYTLLDDAKSRIQTGDPLGLWDLGRLLFAKRGLEKCLIEYGNGKRPLHEVYERFNSHVLCGKSYKLVRSAVDQFVDQCIRRGDIDRGILHSIRLAHERGIKTGILSTSVGFAIYRTLVRVNFADTFDAIEANSLVTHLSDGEQKVEGCTINIYNQKPEILEERFLKPYHLREKDVIYFGDSNDDIGVAEMLPVGNFIVPFFATDAFRQYAGQGYGAFVPDTKEDLDGYLKAR